MDKNTAVWQKRNEDKFVLVNAETNEVCAHLWKSEPQQWKWELSGMVKNTDKSKHASHGTGRYPEQMAALAENAVTELTKLSVKLTFTTEFQL